MSELAIDWVPMQLPDLTYIYAPVSAQLIKRVCYETDFMTSLSADIIEVFNATSRYLDDLLHIDNLYFEGMVN